MQKKSDALGQLRWLFLLLLLLLLLSIPTIQFQSKEQIELSIRVLALSLFFQGRDAGGTGGREYSRARDPHCRPPQSVSPKLLPLRL